MCSRQKWKSAQEQSRHGLDEHSSPREQGEWFQRASWGSRGLSGLQRANRTVDGVEEEVHVRVTAWSHATVQADGGGELGAIWV